MKKQAAIILETIIPSLPEVPGVYRMKNAKWDIIYVGKSINLRSRVRSYFVTGATLNAAKIKMVAQVDSIDWVETRSESEALVLETNLIKELRPKYNVLMKDDKDLTYIRILDGVSESVERVRRRTAVGEFFGPYTSGSRISLTLRHLKRIFRIRDCRVEFGGNDAHPTILSKAGKSIPCMDYYIGICPWPCLLTPEALGEHRANIAKLREFLQWKTGEILSSLEEKMRDHAKKLEFEEAWRIKEQIEAIKTLGERQIARNSVEWNVDGFCIIEKHDAFFAGFVSVRNGEIRAIERFMVENPLAESLEFLSEFAIAERYSDSVQEHCDTLLLDASIASDTLNQFLSDKKIRVEHPEIGAKKELLVFLRTNLLNFAQSEAMKELSKRTLSRATMVSILEAIGYSAPKKWPLSFECYDISHTDGHFTVASRSVVENGKPKNSDYKKYKIKTLPDGNIDDFASMREVLERRTLEGLRENNFPTMIVIDGGKWQLSAALGAMERTRTALQESSTEELPALPFLSSLAKREEEIFIPGKSESHLFAMGSIELSLITMLRDEAHRFAITFNRSMRSKEMRKNILEELPGFGPVTRKKLLKLAGSVAGIKELSEAELSSILTKTQFETLRDHALL